MYRKITILNRPISPHLSIYNPQITSLSSIWHRISGILIVFIVVSFNIISKIVFNFTLIDIPIEILLNSICFVYLITFFLFLYHSLNGIRNILWSLSCGLKIINMENSFYILFFFIFCLFIINLV
uniref:succinate dehydrogenase subunit 3 n=1 Tax=Hypnea flava TaxID=1524266 RepID=UPI00300284D9|nr:succinate dehydrogenase subunit 3 [Hypnea flava]